MTPRRVALELSGCALLAGGAALVACTSLAGSTATSNATVTTYVPLTSIQVDANALFQRLGCGVGAGVPYKYVVSVYAAYANGELQGTTDDGGTATPLTIGVSDCFTDAVFQNLSNPTNYYGLKVDVYDLPTYQALRGTIDLDDPGVQGVLATAPTAATAATLHAAAKWSTSCSALQQPNVQSLAVCNPLP